MASGTDLKVERVRAGLTLKEVARRMGVSRQTLWGIERSESVDQVRESQYLAALASGGGK